MQIANNPTDSKPSLFSAYLELCKPRVVALMLLTSLVGMLLATPSFQLSWQAVVLGLIGIALSAGAGATLNHVIDRGIDAKMSRTNRRPIPSGRISSTNALVFSLSMTAISMFILFMWVNSLTAILTFLTLIGYGVIYTVFLKRATPQNIVIGGLAGAMPPLLGWTAVAGQVDYTAILLVLIIFAWTPPHFWALSIYRHKEYMKANIPMLPVTHGIPYTKLHILLYTFLLFAVSLLPFVIDVSGLIYFIAAIVLGLRFIYWAVRLMRSDDPDIPLKMFRYSIYYLGYLFFFLLLDHFFPILT